MDIKQLLLSLLDHKVKFIIIGAWALPAYGVTRMTGDVDIFIKPTPQNAKRTMKALQAIGYDVVRDVPPETFLKKKVLLRQYILQADIHPFVAGIDFDTAWRNRVKTEISGVDVYVPSLGDIMKMKKAAGRDKDKQDLKSLKEFQKQTEKQR
jgi:predicted nucleotidyltransferase